MLVPRSPSFIEMLDPRAVTKAANESLVQQHFLECPQMQATDLVVAVRRRIENIRSEGVLGEQRHQRTSLRPSSKNPPGHALTSSPRSFSGICRAMLRAPSFSTRTI